MTEAQLTTKSSQALASQYLDSQQDFLTLRIDGQLFGLPVLQIQDVLGPQKVTRIALAPPEIAGALNLRGRIVTAIDVRRALGLQPKDLSDQMSVVVEYDDELFSLIIDEVGDVLNMGQARFETNPGTLDKKWLDVSDGIYRLEEELLVILNIDELLRNISTETL